MRSRYPLALPRPPARSPQTAALAPHARREEVSQSLQMEPAPATRGSARAQQLQPPWSGSARLLEAAPACGQQSRARDQVPSAFGRREVCSHGPERAGGCTSESCAPFPPRCEPSQSCFTAVISWIHKKNVAAPPPTARRRGRGYLRFRRNRSAASASRSSRTAGRRSRPRPLVSRPWQQRSGSTLGWTRRDPIEIANSSSSEP